MRFCHLKYCSQHIHFTQQPRSKEGLAWKERPGGSASSAELASPSRASSSRAEAAAQLPTHCYSNQVSAGRQPQDTAEECEPHTRSEAMPPPNCPAPLPGVGGNGGWGWAPSRVADEPGLHIKDLARLLCLGLFLLLTY